VVFSLIGLLVSLLVRKNQPEQPDPSAWRTSYPAFCRCIKEGIQLPGTSAAEPILWSAVYLGIENTSVCFDLPDPVNPEGAPLPIRFWPDHRQPEEVAAWEAVPPGTRVRFSAQWNGMYEFDTLTNPKYWKAYIILRKVKFVARE
jgi:hypothetical protein